MKIDQRLNFVVPLYRDDDQVYAYVHSAPVSREVFEANYLLISKTFAAIHSEGLGIAGGPRVAALLMRDIAQRMAGPDGDSASVSGDLTNEIRRLSNVVAPGPSGWTVTPFQEAIDNKSIDTDDLAEVENALAFFTVASAMHQRSVLAVVLRGAARLWGAQLSSLNCTGFAGSLQTSTGTGSSGGTTQAIVTRQGQGSASSLPS